MPKNTSSPESNENILKNPVEERVESLMGPPPIEAGPSDAPVDDSKADSVAVDEPQKVIVIQQHEDDEIAPMIDQLVESTTKDSEQTGETSAHDGQTTETNESFVSDTQPVTTEDQLTDKAVDDIIATEGDELLKADDEKIAAAFIRKPSRRDRFVAWLKKPTVRRVGLAASLLVLLGTGLVPTSRYFVLNTAGVRSRASVIILDEQTRLPLKNIAVNLAGRTIITDEEGRAQFEKLKLGATNLTVEKRAFAPFTRKVTIGWGSNPLSDFSLKPVGAQYTFMVSDFLSNQPLAKAEATSGDASAFSDDKGKIVLTVEPDDAAELTVDVALDSYRTEQITLPTEAQDAQAVTLVPARKHVFVSRRDGKYDVYKVDVDGKNEELILPGSGTERDDMVLAQHPTANMAALVSTRSGDRNDDGFLLSTLTLIDLDSGEIQELGKSERFQVVNWINDRLVYVRIIDGASQADPQRHRLISYDYVKDMSQELASSNYFNDVLSAKGIVYYAPSAAYQSSGTARLFSIKPDGTDKQAIIDKEAWNLFRVNYETLNISVQQQWYEYRLGETEAHTMEGPPSIMRSRLYVDGPEQVASLWVDERDGKGVLISYDVTKREDTVIREQSGLKNPVRWLNDDYITYRISTPDETADYVMSLNGGEPQKIRDVTDTGGVNNWYYY